MEPKLAGDGTLCWIYYRQDLSTFSSLFYDGVVALLANTEGRKRFGAYSASKGDLIALSDSLREEAARFGVRVATISPGKVDTRMHGTDPERPKMIRPGDVAEAVAFLLRLSPTAAVREVRIYNTALGGE